MGQHADVLATVLGVRRTFGAFVKDSFEDSGRTVLRSSQAYHSVATFFYVMLCSQQV